MRLRDIAPQFDGMLIDQFGVIHDGQKLYPGTRDVLENLHRLKIPVAVMTNSAKRAKPNRERLVKMGIPRHLFLDAVSSGDVAYSLLQPCRAFIISRRGDDYGFDGFTLVEAPQDAEVILILGSNAPETSMDEYAELLKDVRIPAVCCNPDKQMLTPSGLQPAPGAIAALYENLGGSVRWIGKPYPEIYHHALKLIGNPAEVLCIGDSAEHDVAGGRNAGCKTLLVKTGVSAGLTEFHPSPDYLMNAFEW